MELNMSRYRSTMTLDKENRYRAEFEPYVFDGTEGDRIVDALVVAMIGANGDFINITRAQAEAKRRLHAMLKQLVPLEAAFNVIENVDE
jgi:hypothetical protein